MDAEIITIRRDICQSCERACEVRATISHADPCAACPTNVWHAFGNCEAAPPAELRGLGDAVALVAKPIARMIDAATATVGIKTNVQGCGRCNKRQSDWNQAVPFK